MTTLERLEKIEQETKALITMLGAVPQVQQEINSLKDGNAVLGKSFQEIVNHVNAKFRELYTYNQTIFQKQLAVEESLSSLSKTMQALVAELEGQKVIDGNNVMVRLREIDEVNEKNKVQQMLKLNIIKQSEVITNESIFVIGQKYVSKEGKEETVSNFRLVEMPSPLTNEEVKAFFVGKKVNEVVEDTNKSSEGEVQGTLFSTILEVYELTQGGQVQGEAPNQEEPNQEELKEKQS